ncbi:hypothetical protein AMECASPLE_037651 [Ameca splendens]|uniref:Uncharacterized protein n=1 Tax=Ameca splendens TaxID=208324 RepID=A0ABV0ZT69_9TELE
MSTPRAQTIHLAAPFVLHCREERLFQCSADTLMNLVSIHSEHQVVKGGRITWPEAGSYGQDSLIDAVSRSVDPILRFHITLHKVEELMVELLISHCLGPGVPVYTVKASLHQDAV